MFLSWRYQVQILFKKLSNMSVFLIDFLIYLIILSQMHMFYLYICLYHEGTSFKSWSRNHLFWLAWLCLCKMWTGTGIMPEYRSYMISSSSFSTLIYLLRNTQCMDVHKCHFTYTLLLIV
jgi:hypothetical protein